MVYYGAKRGPKICNNFRCTFSAPEVPKTSPRRPKMVSRGLRGLPHRVPGWYTMDPNEVQKFSIIFGALFPAPRCPRQAQDGPRWPQEGLVGPSLGSRDVILWIQKMPKNSKPARIPGTSLAPPPRFGPAAKPGRISSPRARSHWLWRAFSLSPAACAAR